MHLMRGVVVSTVVQVPAELNKLKERELMNHKKGYFKVNLIRAKQSSVWSVITYVKKRASESPASYQ